jgi:riboflavin kinase/FMN adenylyltransferase
MKLPLTLVDPNGVVAAGLPVALVVGNFDGVHAGHQSLLAELAQHGEEYAPVVLTFDPHPGNYFRPNSTPLLTTTAEKIELLVRYGATAVATCSFDAALAALDPESFLNGILEAGINVRRVLVGHDFRFGCRREGDFEFLCRFGERHGWQVSEFPAVSAHGEVVSSSLVRRLVQGGDVVRAERFLNRPFSLSGDVVKGDQRGRHIGFPTVNLRTPESLLRPKEGVYAGYVRFPLEGSEFPAVMHFGHRPTFGDMLEFRAEAHLFNFSRDVYGMPARFLLKQQIRPEQKFAGLDALVSQIGRDIAVAKEYLGLIGESANSN